MGKFQTLPSAFGRHLPWEGRLFLYNPSKAPLLGELDAPWAQTEGFCSPATRTFWAMEKTPPYNVFLFPKEPADFKKTRPQVFPWSGLPSPI